MDDAGLRRGQPATHVAHGESRAVLGGIAQHDLRLHAAVVRVEDIAEAPVPSLLRDFSAPVRVHLDQDDNQLALLMAHDPDPFNRWDAGQQLGLRKRLRDACMGCT